MNEMNVPIITIDGPSGAGKGTIAQMLALDLQWNILDSGALYRTLAYFMLEQNIELHDFEKNKAFKKELFADNLKPSYFSWPNKKELDHFYNKGGKLMGLKEGFLYFLRCILVL